MTTTLSRPRPAGLAGLAGLVLATFAAAALGGFASADAPSFYVQLQQPSWSPPASVFGPVWTVLYTMMAVAAGLVWRRRSLPGAHRALLLYGVQLALNALWSWTFFSWRSGALAVLDIAALWIAIVATVVLFWRTRPLAGALLLPYLAWVTFAAALTVALWRLNPGLL